MNDDPLVIWHKEANLWWPIDDKDPISSWNYVSKRMNDVTLAIKHCKQKRTAIQAGAYMGLWPRLIGKHFKSLLAFEIMPSCIDAARRNCEHLPNVQIIPKGLSNQAGTRTFKRSATAGSWRVDPEGDFTAEVITIDSLNLDYCDLICLDIEYHEIQALEGAKETIKRCSPVIHLEVRGKNKEDLPKFMSSLGYIQAEKVHADIVYVKR